jgi:hypothetical protein
MKENFFLKKTSRKTGEKKKLTERQREAKKK